MALKDSIDIKEDVCSDVENTLYLPLIPLRGIVVFPHDVINFDIGRKVSLAAVDAAMNSDRTVFLVAQKDEDVEEPRQRDLYNIGTVGRIRQILRLPDDCVRVLVEGVSKAKIKSYDEVGNGIYAMVESVKEAKSRAKTSYKDALIRKVQDSFAEFAKYNPKMPKDIKTTVAGATEPDFLAEFVAAHMPIPVDDKQYVLEQTSSIKALEIVFDILMREIEICEIDAKINQKTRKQIDENQKDFYLREQLKAISSELYGDGGGENEFDAYYQKIESSLAPDSVKEILKNEVSKLSKMPPGSHEGTVVRIYLDTCLNLPFGKKDKLQLNLKKAEDILEKEHYGLSKVKEQILETIAVYSLKPDTKGRILCLAGPPGVGKTSIAKSLAKCMGRSFERISLGGIHDEAEIRGHRKTYIGAMPGKIIKAVTSAGSTNALILLDEIDKLAADYKGDPASALLEALDAEQNGTFVDHFLDFPFDLSDIFFVTTANNVANIPAPLLDRMDLIELPGYTREDKFQIAKGYLVKKQMSKNGLTAANIKIDDSAILDIIDSYTREAGVRRLERSIAALCRKTARRVAEQKVKRTTITKNNITEFLGVRKYTADEILKTNEVGIVNGLAWTQVGGELMQLEVLATEGTGKVILTGSLGDVMKESANAAISWVRANANRLSIETDFYKTKDIHIHATEAAVPKDGPSAGITITTALVSALTENPIKNTVAMTGEVTIRGRVLPIGGLNEKTMAAYRAGVKTVIMPKGNEPSLEDINQKVRDSLEFVLASEVDTVLKTALERDPFSATNRNAIPLTSGKSSTDFARV